jgi:formate dehydrogenase subunit delta
MLTAAITGRRRMPRPVALSDKPHAISRPEGSRSRRTHAYDGCMSSSQYLVHMANDIGNFFRGQQQRDIAIAGIANHMKSFWTRRMREKLLSQLEHGEDGLDELPLEALRFLAGHPGFKAKQQPGGDAG